MIQPVSALSPRATVRGTNGKSAKQRSSSIALINAGGVAAAAGGLTTAVARRYTSSWTHAGVLGLGGAFLAMFFMTPQLIEKSSLNRNSDKKVMVKKDDAGRVAETVKEHLKPAKKLVQFRQS